MSYIDQFSAESILVIKKPPTSAPSIVTSTVADGTVFLEDRFICFAYRYEYQNGEFSATSQFSAPAFQAGVYRFSESSFLNEGMLNTANVVQVTFDTGGPLVVAIQLLYKDMSDPTIKIIETINKAEQGLGDNNSFTFTFDDQKIFTVLPEFEILRLYDNVPLKAQAQTLMGNRLVYGNYFEGYNLKDRQNNAINFTYNLTLSSSEVNQTGLVETIGDGYYTYGQTATKTNSIFFIDLSSLPLRAGSTISWTVNFTHLSFYTSAGSAPTALTPVTEIGFSYTLIKDYATVYDLATDSHFQDSIGTSSNVQTVGNACNGFTFSDVFNCSIPSTLGAFAKTESGITAATQGFAIQSVPSGPNDTRIGLQLLAMKWVDGVNVTYEYYQVLSAESFLRTTNNNFSLHSNRDYEIGIVYMDDFNRSSTALVGPLNTTHVPCQNSVFLNGITVNIPGGQAGGAPAQHAPYWATRYKFCIKSSKSTYETIYVSSFVKEDNTAPVYFLLEGENANKVEEGDRLIVKKDSSGALRNCATAVVLEKQAQLKGFIEFTDPLNPSGPKLQAPPGTYMKMIPTNFAVSSVTNPIITYGNISGPNVKNDHYPKVFYPVTIPNPAGSGATANISYDIPENSSVKIKIKSTRPGGKSSAPCENLVWSYEQDIIASATFANFKEFFDGEGLGVLTSGAIQKNSLFQLGNPAEELSFDNGTNIQYNNSTLQVARDPVDGDISQGVQSFFFRFIENTNTGEIFLGVSGGRECPGRGDSRLDVEIEVIRAQASVVFETQPLDALPDVWFENEKSFGVDSLGQHLGSIQNQIIDIDNSGVVTAQDAIVETGFTNCIAFGDGIESYKIRDSITGKGLTFGNRTTTTSSQIYKEAHRFSDLTYSGVFNDESNVNKLNEFNLGLANFSPLEDSFGPIRKLYSRRTDILTLQEDRISYVPVGKDLLTDAAGGGALTSVPQVLGVQIARDEEYGISNNPESFAVWGYDKYFVDSKRGAVIRLRGGSSGQEELSVISERGMRGWFRDFFINSLGTQKLGGYDPYTNEFVLAGNLQNTFDFRLCLGCDVAENLVLEPGKRTIYCVDVGQDVGQVTVSYIIPDASDDNIITEIDTPTGAGLQIMETEAGISPIVTEDTNTGVGYTFNAYYNGVKYTSGLVFVSGSFTIPKNNVNESEVTIEATTNASVADSAEVTVSCPEQNLITVYNIALTNNGDALKTIHNEYRWTDNVLSSPLESNLVTFASGTNPVVSQYYTIQGALGSNAVPDEGSLVSIISNKFSSDTFDFNITTNKLRFLRSATVYNNTTADINALVSASTEATPIVTTAGSNYATFTMPTMTTADNNLYLIWDYRTITAITLCQNTTDFGALAEFNSCCSCAPPAPTTPCSQAVGYTGGQSYPDRRNIELGSGTGTVTVEFRGQTVPDRMIVKFDGVTVIDSQYHGGQSQIPNLHQELSGTDPNTGSPYVEPTSGNAYAPNGTAPLPTVANGGFIQGTQNVYKTFTFNKNTATTSCQVEVYGPLSGTAYDVNVSCPT
tara:strand:- start:1528 stop:6105 length:4578 start_codon:yes stop_codon:yes gene_type:complete